MKETAKTTPKAMEATARTAELTGAYQKEKKKQNQQLVRNNLKKKCNL